MDMIYWILDRSKSLKYLIFLFFSLSLFCKKSIITTTDSINVSNLSRMSSDPYIAVDSKGTVHIVWEEYYVFWSEILYIFKPKGIFFSIPIKLSERGVRFPSIVVDKTDKVHLAHQKLIDRGWVIFYQFKPLDGEWSPPERVILRSAIGELEIAVDTLRNTHIVCEYTPPDLFFKIFMRDRFGNWSNPSILPERGFSHYLRSGGKCLCDIRKYIYTVKRPGQEWSKPEYPPHHTYCPEDKEIYYVAIRKP